LDPSEMPYQWDPEQFAAWLLPWYPAEYMGSGVNLTAVLPATEPSDRWVLVGAHYDTVPNSPGAEDNASGVAAALAVAVMLQQVESRPVNVMFVFFDQEEPGLVGSIMGTVYLAMGGIFPEGVHLLDSVSWDGDNDRATQLMYWYEPDNPFVPQPYDYLGDVLPLYQAADAYLDDLLPPPMRPGDIVPAITGFSDHAGVIVGSMMLGLPAFPPAVTIGTEWVSGDDISPYVHGPFTNDPTGEDDTCDHVDPQQLLRSAAMVAVAVELYMNPL